MNSLMVFVFTIGLLTETQTVSAQVNTDSLISALETLVAEDEKLAIQLLLSEAFLESNLEKARERLDLVYSELNERSKPKFWLRYHLDESIYHRISGDTKQGLISAYKALDLAETHKDSIHFKAKIYNSLGALYDDDSNAELSLKNHFKALRYAESINYEAQVATVCNGIGRVYLYLSEYDDAKKYYLRSIEIKERLNEYDQHLGTSYNNLSNCYDAEGKYKESLVYLDKAIQLKVKSNSFVSLIGSYNNKAYTLYLMNRLGEAETTIQKAIHLADSLAVEIENMYAYSTYAEILFAQNKIAKAEEYMTRSIEMSKKNKDLYLAKYNLDLMYNIYLKKGDYKKALDFFRERSVVMDSVYNIRSRSEIEKLALTYETEKKNKEIELLNTENELNTIDLKKSRQLQIAFLIVALLAFAVMALLWSRHKNKVKTDKILKDALEKSYEKKLSDTELQVLRAQMNPHFLFNCLNSINSFIIKNEQEQASEYLSKFSMLIRKVLSNSKSSKVTLANELEALELYIEMEALRFGNSFEHAIIIGDDVEKDYLEIPPLIIQPYVENSIWHGLMHKTNGHGKLVVDIQQENDMLICAIEDNGVGREAASAIKSKQGAIKRKSFGMNITKERLEHINEKYKETSHVEITDLKSESGAALGTRVIIKIAI